MRDQIVRCTNSQNKMPAEALRATDPIHRKIEEGFAPFGLFYDRRKGHYKDVGKPVAKIVSVRDVLQATLAIALRQPDDARARPADYLRDETRYNKVFENDRLQIPTYLKCTEVVRAVEAFDLHEKHVHIKYLENALNLLFYVSLGVAVRLTNHAFVPPSLINGINLSDITPRLIEETYADVFPIYEKHGGDDRAAKGTDMRRELLKSWEKTFNGT